MIAPRDIIWGDADTQRLRKFAHQHKYDHGHSLIVAGECGHTGAARLAARAALRIGSGLVTIAAPPNACAEIAHQISALMLCALPDSTSLQTQLTDPRLSAVCIGPGLGLTEAKRAQVLTVLAATRERAALLDADALSLFEPHPEQLFAQLHPNTVLTPHAGEFRRIFPDLADFSTDTGRAAACWAACERAGCTVLLKGADTLIAHPQAGLCRHRAQGEQAAPWLATAGAGDVLAGMITGLMARGIAPYTAAQMGCYLHVACARQIGPGLIAEDLPEALPKVLRQLGL